MRITAVFTVAALMTSFVIMTFAPLHVIADEKNNKEKRYRIEMVIFQNKAEPPTGDPELGTPDLRDAVPFIPLATNKLVLTNAKKRFTKRGPPVLHEGWLQTAGTKDKPTLAHIKGGKELSNGSHEVEGFVKVEPGKQLFITTDLVVKSEQGSEVIPTHRLQATIPVVFDELNYINTPYYSMIVMVTPDVTRRISVS